MLQLFDIINKRSDQKLFSKFLLIRCDSCVYKSYQILKHFFNIFGNYFLTLFLFQKIVNNSTKFGRSGGQHILIDQIFLIIDNNFQIIKDNIFQKNTVIAIKSIENYIFASILLCLQTFEFRTK